MNCTKPCLAELIGTFFLCFAGIAAIISTELSRGASDGGIVGIALAHGLALSVAVATFGGVSGGHFNPAVTIGMLVTGRIKPVMAGFYIVSQLAGASLAAVCCARIFPVAAISEAKLGIPLPAGWVDTAQLFTTEMILTFLLVTAVFGVAVDPRGKQFKIGALAIGLTATFCILAGGQVTGASMNPARSFGPALVHMHWEYHMWYWLGPIAGGVAAAVLYHFVLLGDDAETAEKSQETTDA